MSHLMSQARFAVILAALCAPDARAQTAVETRLWVAVVEWTVAHCGIETVPALALNVAHVAASGADPADMENARARVRQGVAGAFDDPLDACPEMIEAARLLTDGDRP